GKDYYTGLYGIEPIWAADDPGPPSAPALRFTADKFITPDDVLVSAIRVHNPTNRPQPVTVQPWVHLQGPYSHKGFSRTFGSRLGNPAREELLYDQISASAKLHETDIRINLRFAVTPDQPIEVSDLKVALDTGVGIGFAPTTPTDQRP